MGIGSIIHRLTTIDQAISDAEAIARRIQRRDPKFVDAIALQAAVRWMQGDAGGAANAVARLCGGADGQMWCARYASAQVVQGRWTPSAVEAYRSLLQDRAVQLELRNWQPMAR